MNEHERLVRQRYPRAYLRHIAGHWYVLGGRGDVYLTLGKFVCNGPILGSGASLGEAWLAASDSLAKGTQP